MPGFKNSLISIRKLCDAECTATFDKNKLTVYDNTGAIVLSGTREQAGAQLWRVNIAPQTLPAALLTTLSTSSQPHVIPMDEPAQHRPGVLPGTDQQPVETQQHPTGIRDTELQQKRITTPSTPPKPLRPTGPKVPTQRSHPATKTTYYARAYDLPSVPALIAFLHATAGYPVKQTWLEAIKRGAYDSWPGLTAQLAARYCPTTDETIKGHMAQPRQHIRSTQPNGANPNEFTSPATPTATDTIHLEVVPVNKLFTDDTGRFQPRSRSGNQYVMVALHTQSNAILVQPFANKSDTHRIPAYQAIYNRLKAVNNAPMMHIMDNEASAALQHVITTNGCQLQLVPQHVHRRNAAERAIRTFKDHFLACLAGMDPTFPADCWDLLLPQVELTLNLLRPTPLRTATSAWEALFGKFTFDATPMGPAGCKVLIHAKPAVRRSWDFRVHDGYHLGPALSHYRCYRVLTKTSKAVLITDAVRFRPHKPLLPAPTMNDKLLHALHRIDSTLATNAETPSTTQLLALHAIRGILNAYAQPTQPAQADKAITHPFPGVPGNATRTQPPTTATTPPHTTYEEDWTEVRRGTRHTANHPEPVATHTRARLANSNTNAFALLAECDDDDTTPTRLTTPLAVPIIDQETGESLEHRQLRKHPKYKQVWDTSYANELGRLCQGVGTNANDPTKKRVDRTNTFHPIHFQDIPNDRRRDVTYTRVVCKVRPQKEDPNRTRITIGGNRICYPGDTATRTGSVELVKLQVNSVISMKDARFACYDISNFYLGTPLDRPKYVQIRICDIPQEFIDEYDLTLYEHNGWVYFEITNGVYRLKQAGKLANDLLAECLDAHGYYQSTTTPGFWKHRWRPISFVLIVDDFGIKYVGKQHADHLLMALTQHYKVTTDWTGSKFAGIDLAWNYPARTVRLTMTGYIADVLLKYNHTRPTKPQHAPHACRTITYGAREQLLPDKDTSPPLSAAGIKRIQAIIGSLLYYARAVDNKLLATLSSLSAQQAQATENTDKAVKQLLEYVATYPADGVTYRASTMTLAAHSDASFLTKSGSRSRAGAHIFLTDDDPIPRSNGPVLTMSQIIKFVMASAAEAELAALYLTAREMIPLRQTLKEMGWKQPCSPIQTDNSTAVGFISDTIIQRRIKMIWMRLHWLRCRAAQGQFRFYWDKGSQT